MRKIIQDLARYTLLSSSDFEKTGILIGKEHEVLESVSVTEICSCMTLGKVHNMCSNYITQHVQWKKKSAKTVSSGNNKMYVTSLMHIITWYLIYVQNQ